MRQKGLPDVLLLGLLPRVMPSWPHQCPHSVPCSSVRRVLSLFLFLEPLSVLLPDGPSCLAAEVLPTPIQATHEPCVPARGVCSAYACGVKGPGFPTSQGAA